ncbi:RagB/SusD family nutrient uptake outer membrane protein [Sphingobacterium olei]|uniref:RagB/SusD family nutrient uptake outer membrane protein n=1 Tax=Sphingobacterium olei TaxID=2571155 RepID=A0A4U0P0Y2_9SPHI|nr:RagB/SusD family nutrient uptake outer membrane protein [Sphingobacterium olei]TJZ60700.1 RagB/SusD family nutrient uptake outer membrane protein [Sphingobacterium olei]
MIKRYYNFLIISGLVLVFTSCNKYLDQNPDMRTEIDNVDKVAQLIGTAYPSYNYLAMAEHSSDNVSDKGVAIGTNDSPYSEYYYWEDVIGSGNNTPTQYWNTCYAAIAAANHALDAIEKNNLGNEVRPYKGEALVARAYAHFMLALFFAQPYEIDGANDSPGIPYIDRPETVALAQYERGTVKETYDKIRADLEEGLPMLAGGVWKVPKYHFNTSSASAFASRFYLFTGEFQKALSSANNVFGNGDYTNKIRQVNSVLRLMTSAEYLLEMTKPDKDFNLLIRETYSVYQRQTGASVYQRFGYGQKKYNEFFATEIFPGTMMYTKGLSYSSGQHYTSYMWNEYFHITNIQAGTGFPYIMQPILTSDEALFNRAEAYAQLGNDAKALEDINHLLSQRVNNYNDATHSLTLDKAHAAAGTTDTKAALIHIILKMKQRAFVTEGVRWMDIVRHRLPVVHVVLDENDEETEMVLESNDLRRVFQIPSEASLAGVSQNPR